MVVSSGNKVLIIYGSSQSVCGIGTWVDALAAELSERSWDVTVGLTWGRRHHDPRRVEAAHPKLKTIWMDGRTGTDEGRIRAIEQAIIQTRPNIVVLTCLDAAFEAVRRLKYAGADFKFVATNHGNLAEQAAALIQHRDIIDVVACVSRLAADTMRSLSGSFPSDRIWHIPNGVPGPSARMGQCGGSGRRVGFAARLSDVKNAGDLVPFFQRLSAIRPDAELWIAGEGQYQAEVASLAAEHPSQVRYFGALSHAELYTSFYPKLDVFVNFSANEGWGLAIAEAMAHGVVPVISEHCGVHSEGFVVDGRTGLLFPIGDVARAATLVAEVFDSPRRSELGQAAAETMKSEYSLRSFGDRWDAALKQCFMLPALPRLQKPASLNRRGRFGFKETQLEFARRLLRRRIPHASSGEEWPHFVCRDPALAEQARKMSATVEAAARCKEESVAKPATSGRL